MSSYAFAINEQYLLCIQKFKTSTDPSSVHIEGPSKLEHIPISIQLAPTLCPFDLIGINNSSESSYIRSFTAHCLEIGFRVVVFNHLGALKSEKLTGHRIFTYGTLSITMR